MHYAVMSSRIDEDGGAEAVCRFCSEHYHYDVPELEELREKSLERA